MSHFSVYVFTNDRDVDSLLAPYDENITVAPYVEYTKEKAIEKVRKEIEDYKNSEFYKEWLSDPIKYKENYRNEEHIRYLEEDFPKKLKWTDEECYEDMKKWYDEEMIDADGNLLSTYNPNSKWDWYGVGGRWNGALITKAGNHLNRALVKDVDWSKTNIPFAFVDNIGKWFEKGEMGWWGCVSNAKEEDAWNKEFKKFLDNLSEDTLVTIVDCHI